jgi:hypothetical protein
VGPRVPDLLLATASAHAAIAGLAAAAAWPSAPRPVPADGLLPERALAGDPAARRGLVDTIAVPLTGAVRATVEAFLDTGSLEGAARALFVHPNTVRYRLRRATELTGQPLTTARGAYVVRTALAVERLLGERPDGIDPRTS